jgi:hypothetical protein
MKEIKAYIRGERAAAVQEALAAAGISRMTLSHVMAVGAQNDADKAKASIEFGCYVNRRVKVARRRNHHGCQRKSPDKHPYGRGKRRGAVTKKT